MEDLQTPLQHCSNPTHVEAVINNILTAVLCWRLCLERKLKYSLWTSCLTRVHYNNDLFMVGCSSSIDFQCIELSKLHSGIYECVTSFSIAWYLRPKPRPQCFAFSTALWKSSEATELLIKIWLSESNCKQSFLSMLSALHSSLNWVVFCYLNVYGEDLLVRLKI